MGWNPPYVTIRGVSEPDEDQIKIAEAMRLLNKRRNAKLTPAERAESASRAGKTSAKKLTKAQRSARARRAARAKWDKVRKEKEKKKT